MCKKLLPCNKQSGQDCKECYKYWKKVLSPEASFQPIKGKLCDCIIQCDGSYIIVEIKNCKVTSGEAKDVIEQLKNCEDGLRGKCGANSQYSKVLLYEKFDIPPAKSEQIKSLLKKERIEYYSIKNLKGKKICQYKKA